MELSLSSLQSGILLRQLEALKSKIHAPFRLELWDGRRIDFSPNATVTIRVPSFGSLKYFAEPSLASLGEAFVDGRIDVEGPLPDVIEVADRLSRVHGASPLQWARGRSKKHTRRVDAESISYHYDVSNDFYSLWLDRNMVYSCAYFKNDADTLDTAQEQKLDHICRKLRLQPGDRFLDIGCGWGGLIRWATRQYGVKATGITISNEQHAYATQRIAADGLQDRCSVELMDYRDLPGESCFDKIASVGMFEHVGMKNLPEYFATVARLLRDRGLFLNHGITAMSAEGGAVGMGAGEFIDRYVFPHGELPSLTHALGHLSDNKLEVVDVESLRPHYAKTLAIWADRLVAHRDEARAIAGERRTRIWQIYLAGCAHGFRRGWMSIYQILASKQAEEGPTELPLTRGDLYSLEQN